ncbi:MAG: hypothetical protein J6A37_07080 [Oscillospiraceae bacterium]|nr:hypothetical protein [Oscillospiraceae bacterium]
MAEKKYVIDNAELMAEWDWDKNNELKLDPKKLTLGSGQKVWWKCRKGHEWQASIINRNKIGSNCPYCSGKKVLKGFNDLQTVNPTLAAEWNYEKNGGLTPMDITPGSKKKVWWKCSEGHEWQADISSRNLGNRCPYCSGRFAVKGENDLQTVNPNLAKEWNYDKNNGLSPIDVLPNSGKKVWWKCNKGHEWQTSIAHRNKGRGCPYCAGQKVIKGENDLQTVNPTLANEWNYEKNNGLTPEEVMPNSGKKVWWKCRKGHEWQAKIYHRNTVSDCPVCHSERNTSFPEYALVFYLEKYGLKTIHSYKEKGYELDVYIPSKKAAIEYDGYFWHKNKTQEDLEKNRKCEKDRIKLYRIREGLPPLNDSSIDYMIQKNHKDLPQIFEEILNVIIGKNIDVDLKRDSIAIENLREYTEKVNSFLFSNPEIANEWNYEKNGNLKPEYFAANSGKKVWWKCSKGHEWQATMNSRNHGHRCPYCSGLCAVKGENDLNTVNPSLAKEWNYERNNGLTPMDVLPNSDKKVWWKCQNGHEWQATIGNRNKGCGCPYCTSRKVLKGYNDLQTINPCLANEWNYEKNNGLTPVNVTPGSNKKAWWRCSNGHEWQASIADRNSGRGCPYCTGKKVLKGYNDLQTVNPTLAKEWNYEKNSGLTPLDITPGSNKKVWWKCSQGHEWQATIYNRNRGNRCPYCTGQKVVKTNNDL